MIALYRPVNHEVHPDVPALLAESERLDYEEMREQAYQPRLADYAMGMLCVACVVCFVWLFRVGEP